MVHMHLLVMTSDAIYLFWNPIHLHDMVLPNHTSHHIHESSIHSKADAASGESQTLITRKPVWNEQASNWFPPTSSIYTPWN